MVQNRMNTFYGMQPTIGQPYAAQATQQFQQPYGIAWVYGEEGAKAYIVAPGYTMYLLDKESDKMYVKGTDINGNLLPIKTYRVVEDEQVENHQNDYPTREEFDSLSTKVDKMVSVLKSLSSKNKEKGGNEK